MVEFYTSKLCTGRFDEGADRSESPETRSPTLNIFPGDPYVLLYVGAGIINVNPRLAVSGLATTGVASPSLSRSVAIIKYLYLIRVCLNSSGPSGYQVGAACPAAGQAQALHIRQGVLLQPAAR
jgi:hypothetical protein